MIRPVWTYVWKVADKIRIEAMASHLDSLANEIDGVNGTIRSKGGNISSQLNTNAGKNLSLEYSSLSGKMDSGVSQELRAAARELRAYNDQMETLWEAFLRELQAFEAWLSAEKAKVDAMFNGGGQGGGSW